MERKHTEWTIFEKKENGQEQHNPNAINEALSWFFRWNGMGESTADVYDFLKQFLNTEKIDDEYGRIFFVTSGDGIKLQKFVGNRGFHDDHTSVTNIYLIPATEAGLALRNHPIDVPSNAEWKPLENNSEFYRKEWFDGCGNAKAIFEEKIVKGSYCGKVICPIFFITNIPGAPGHYLLKTESLHD